jgi:hypothetical protein
MIFDKTREGESRKEYDARDVLTGGWGVMRRSDKRPNLRVRISSDGSPLLRARNRFRAAKRPVQGAARAKARAEEYVRAKTNMVKRIRAHGGCLGAVRR